MWTESPQGMHITLHLNGTVVLNRFASTHAACQSSCESCEFCDINLYFIFSIPRGVYIDPFELQVSGTTCCATHLHSSRPSLSQGMTFCPQTSWCPSLHLTAALSPQNRLPKSRHPFGLELNSSVSRSTWRLSQRDSPLIFLFICATTYSLPLKETMAVARLQTPFSLSLMPRRSSWANLRLRRDGSPAYGSTLVKQRPRIPICVLRP
jgi:hypothetical protein